MMQNASVLSLAVLAGWGATQFRLPLAWVLAPMLVVAFASMLGLRMPEINSGRKLGQLIVGSAIGLTMTSDGLGYIVSWLPLMLLTTLLAIGITVFLTVPFARLSGQSKVTAFFSLTPGGLSEMAKLGNSVGAKSEVVALAQAVRVSIIVLLLPFLLRHYGEDGAIYSGKVRSELSFITYLLVLVISFGSVQIIRLFRVNNPWMIGALIAAALLAGNDYIDGLAPWLPFALGQYLIGISIGARFKRESMQGLTRTLGVMLFMVLLMSALLAVYACFLVYLVGFSLTTAILLSSPGGMAEMALTANVLHLNVMLVTAFHFVRSLIVNAWALSFYKISERYHVFGWIEQRWDNLLDRSW